MADEQLVLSHFRPHVGTTFVLTNTDPEHTLELTEAEDIRPEWQREKEGADAETGQFSLTFRGAPDVQMPQAMYTLRHDDLGEVELFLVPVGHDAEGFYVHSIFNSPLDKSLLPS